MFDAKLYSKDELQEMLDNTRGFFEYSKLKEQLEQDEDRHGAFSWLFDPLFAPFPIDPEEKKRLSKTDIWWISTRVGEALDRAWNTPPEFRDREYKFRV